MTNKELEKLVGELSDRVTALTSSVVAMVDKLPKVEVKVDETPINLESKVEKALGGVSDPVPQEYRSAVDELLNQNFGIHQKAMVDMPRFKFTILVPKEYSKEPEYDFRLKVLDYSMGVHGVKDWCEKVLGSFDSDTRQRIISERKLINSVL